MLILPTSRNLPLTSPHGRRVMGNRSVHHCGIDIGGASGSQIYAAADGIVVNVLAEVHTRGYGDLVQIRHTIAGKTYWTVYAHLLKNSTKVHVGQQVNAGDHIAGMGTTGFSSGVHLHFEFNNTPAISTSVANDLDPLEFIADAYSWAFQNIKPGVRTGAVRALQRLIASRQTFGGSTLPDTGFWGDMTTTAMMAICGSNDINAFLSAINKT